MKEIKILIVEDEWNMRNLIKIYLSSQKDFILYETEDGQDAIKRMREESFDIVILDIMLPKINGWEVCKQIRSFSTVPILMLTARTEIKDKVKGLKIGADDYLTKPFAKEELEARIVALLRRSNAFGDGHSQKKIELGELKIIPSHREVKVRQVLIELTPKEYDLLLLLANHPKNVFTREHLLSVIWDHGDERDSRTVDTHIKNVREKLRKANLSFNPIKTVWGIGYRMGDTHV